MDRETAGELRFFLLGRGAKGESVYIVLYGALS